MINRLILVGEVFLSFSETAIRCLYLLGMGTRYEISGKSEHFKCSRTAFYEVVDDSFICLYDVKCPIFFCSVIYWIIFEFIGLYWYSRVPKLTFPSAAALIYDDQSPVTSCHNNVIIAVCLKTADHRRTPQTTADHPRTARKPHGHRRIYTL